MARGLSEPGVDQRLVVRDHSKAPTCPEPTSPQLTTMTALMSERRWTGAHTVFMVSASETSRPRPTTRRLHRRGVDAEWRLVRLRVLPRCLFHGNLHPGTGPLGERGDQPVGVAYTILRDNIYADFTPHLIGTDGNICGPAGDGRVAVVAQADIAEVAVAVLISDGAYDGRTLNLTGPEAVTMYEIADTLSDHLGRTVSYIPETIDEAYASRASYGAPRWQVDSWVSTYTAIAAGELGTVSEDIPEVTGHPAMTLKQVLGAG